jgi:hypothetical protein
MRDVQSGVHPTTRRWPQLLARVPPARLPSAAGIMSLADNPRLRARVIREAIGRPAHFLAAALAELPDEDLAAAIGASSARVWRLRLAGYPRTDQWERDIRILADLVGGDDRLLEALLVDVGVRPGAADA